MTQPTRPPRRQTPRSPHDTEVLSNSKHSTTWSGDLHHLSKFRGLATVMPYARVS